MAAPAPCALSTAGQPHVLTRPLGFVCASAGISRGTTADEWVVRPRHAHCGKVQDNVVRFQPDLDARAPENGPSRDHHGAFPLHVAPPVLSPHVKRTIDLQHDDTAVGQNPLAVQIAAASLFVSSDSLPIGWSKPHTGAKAPDVDLREGVRTAGDVSKSKPELSTVAQL